MNTIPLIFNERISPYTIVGGDKNQESANENFFSVFILGRPDSITSDVAFENILSFQFKSVYAIFPSAKNIESLVEKFPIIRFIKTSQELTIGEMINICAAECSSQFFIVLWSDTVISSQGFIDAMLEQILGEKNICTVPAILNDRHESIPNQMVPILNAKHFFDVQKFPVLKDKTLTIYPFDFIGIYNRQKFIDVAGFDYTIKNPYWQVLDFSLRSYLYGFMMSIATSFKVRYIGEIPVEQVCADDSYRTFFLKNLAVQIKKSEYSHEAYIPKKVFFSYLNNAHLHLLERYRHFKRAKKWVLANKDRFKKTALDLVGEWEPLL